MVTTLTGGTYVGSVDSLTLPRSVLLALWLAEPSPGSGPVDRLLSAVQGEDEPHRTDDGGTLADLVARWAAGPRSVAAVLPAPGDPAGAPAPVAGPAQDAGEAVLVHTPEGDWAAVPQVETFGSVYEPGHLVTWRITPVSAWQNALIGQVGTLREAERELTGALTRATDALTSLDVARWREDAAEEIALLAAGADPRWPLPPGLDQRRVRVLTQAARLRAIIELATGDDGAAVNLWQVDQRSTALRDVDRAARRALAAATHPGPPLAR
ncbi:hypothetical protein Cde04nite_20840 [Cellulomonas denverensis]|uniref:Uncharacterized protein n=1 Tax=Cellulomonas denverensis TaxID=264297 RepID=A0A7X6QYT2_9CELL|nr:hypothetical protein [Cellulomonas denverensis]NKY22331.1 hypothetical protein [Cellulomonas denverensis]GIG25840.1 hypothetical protein Cde04nite_20840 [Cellulomonas denverensis]